MKQAGFALLILFTILPSFAAGVQTVKIASVEIPPISIYAGHKTLGVGVDIANELLKRNMLDEELVRITSSRFLDFSRNHVALFASVTRTPEREAKFKWLGRIVESKPCFVTTKDQTPVKSYDQAKKLSSVAVTGKGAVFAILERRGFKNLDLAVSASGALRKLKAGKVNAWFTSGKIVADYYAKEEGLGAGSFSCVPMEEDAIDLWIAASVKMPDEMFQKLSATFKKLQSEGFIEATINRYK